MWQLAKQWFAGHRRWTYAGVAGLVIVVLVGIGATRRGQMHYFTAAVEQGDIVAIVQATGTIDAVTTVQVGSQVSGLISALYADFNSKVKKGELIAQIDPQPFQARVQQAAANLANAQANVKSAEADLSAARANQEKAQAALRQSQLDHQRTAELFQQGIASPQQRDAAEASFDTAKAGQDAAQAQIEQAQARVEQARAQVQQSQAALEQARLDMEHTHIYAPIDGTVIARNVDVGQTVAASFTAPTLFTIAQDLTKMRVYAKTDEADVGKIHVGGDATFTVDSFPHDVFHGTVTQVRMNATQVENVVTYDTVIEFANPEVKLLPGMTAYVTIPVASAHDVVKIPNGALRFKPEISGAQMQKLLVQYGIEAGAATSAKGRGGAHVARAAGADQAGNSGEPPQRSRPSGPSPNGGQGRQQLVWMLNPDNTLRPVEVRTGLTDFTYTAMLGGNLKPGDKLVIGETRQNIAGDESSPLRRMPHRF